MSRAPFLDHTWDRRRRDFECDIHSKCSLGSISSLEGPSEWVSPSVASYSLPSHGLWPARLLCPWDSSGKNTGVGWHSLLQGNLPDPGIETGSHGLKADSLPSPVQSLSCVQLFAAPWTAALQASLCFTISWSLLRFMSIESVMPSNHPSESALRIRWPKYWNCSFSISSSDEHSGLISFRINWFDLLAIQGTLKSLLQHLGSKEVILRYSSFFMVSILLDTLLLLLQRIHPFLSPGSWVVA